MMSVESQKIIPYGRREQARLALSLVDNLGLDGAIFACRANGWDGVLDILVGGSSEDRRRISRASVYHG